MIQLFNAFCVVSDREVGQDTPILGVTDANVVLSSAQPIPMQIIVNLLNSRLGPEAGRPYPT